MDRRTEAAASWPLNWGCIVCHRTWRKHCVRSHRLDTHMVSNDPGFETISADVIGMYFNQPAHAAVFCINGKTAIQALDRKDRQLPLLPGHAENHGFEYKSNGTLNLFAALNTITGEVLGKTASRHASQQFVAFPTDIVVSQPRRRQLHVICGNVSRHETTKAATFLNDHPIVHISYTPTYLSWLNQVKNWFVPIQRGVITRGTFTPIKNLDKKIMRNIRKSNECPKPIKWKNANPTRRVWPAPFRWFTRLALDEGGIRFTRK